MTTEEDRRYDDIAGILMRRNPETGPADALKASLMARWREPNLTVHRYKVSGPDGGSLVSSHASAKISLRLVPGQELDDVADALTAFLEHEFAELESHNSLSVTIDNKAEPWLGDPTNDIFRTLERAVMYAWAPLFEPRTTVASAQYGNARNGGTKNDTAREADARNGDGRTGVSSEAATSSLEAAAASALVAADNGATAATAATPDNGAPPRPRKPLYIREGGSIPAIRFLEKEFQAPAAHLPCGQASDAAHLDNERLRVLNLLKAREIFGMVFAQL
jgi:di- and tripeptidase